MISKRALLAIFALATICVSAQDEPPPTSVRPVTDTYFGTTIQDPYRHLEDLRNPEVVAWFKA